MGSFGRMRDPGVFMNTLMHETLRGSPIVESVALVVDVAGYPAMWVREMPHSGQPPRAQGVSYIRVSA